MREHSKGGGRYAGVTRSIDMYNRNTMMLVICILAVVTVGSLAAYFYERSQNPGVDIRLDRNGLQIEQR